MRVIICGGTGFIGSELSKALLARGDEVWIVTRQRPAAPAAGFLYVTWEEWSEQPNRMSGFDALVCLAGESVGQRWTDEAKRRILVSRTQTALALENIVGRMDLPPRVLVNASGISIYGHSESPIAKRRRRRRPAEPREILTEERDGFLNAEVAGIRGFTATSETVASSAGPRSSEEAADQAHAAPDAARKPEKAAPGTEDSAEGAEDSAILELLRSLKSPGDSPRRPSDSYEPGLDSPDPEAGSGWYGEESPARPEDFLGTVVAAWEDAVDRIPIDRIVKLRISLVLARQGGSFPLLRLPYKLFAGGRMGSGTQGFPWIHLRDMIALILFCIDREDIEGPVNAVAPDPVNNDQFGRALAKALHRPHWLHAPAALVRRILGEQSALLLAGQHAYPRKALRHGFVFAFPRLEDALRDLTGRARY